MANFDYTHTCGRCAATLFTISNGDGATWKDIAARGYKTTCPACGATYAIEDDGNPSGGVQAKDVSAPKIASIGVSTGPIAGGTTVRVNGAAFQVPGATSLVKFGGLPVASPSVLNDTALDAVTPAGKVRLIVEQVFVRIAHDAVAGGPFQISETITGDTSGATAVVRSAGAGFLVVETPTGSFEAGETLTGNVSGATAAFTADGHPNFSTGEIVTGASSGATATLLDGPSLWIQAPSGPFTAGEDLVGGTSGAVAQLANPTWYDGHVDVVVENEFGRRETQAVLPAAFEYTV
ncbi:MAG TPA: IPT/TIG domain-containing protein [Dehalococcoidia bacterium]|nr:IPT/TIG domain-containing protein [Dehalococcoidia bacterium]HUV47960.1 IPT/TIG domain-containing protein [Actinomycetes bacterium]